MYRFITFRLFLAIVLALGFWANAEASGKIAIDGLHGMPVAEGGPSDAYIDLEALYPSSKFVYFNAAHMPIYEILSEGYMQAHNADTVEVDVPTGVQALYASLEVDYTPGNIDQLPLFYIISPDQTVTNGAYGMCHVDYPEPGRYIIVAYWGSTSIPYRIGTGPCLWEVYPPEDYDAWVHLLCPTWMLFRGTPTPYSDSDFTRLQQMLDSGGGYGLFYDGAEPIALKPVIHIRDFASEGATIRIDIPGRLTYARPQPQSRRPLMWNIAPTDAEEEYYYEGEFRRPLNFVSRGALSSSFVNRSWATVRDLKSIEFVRGEGYRISEFGTLAPGEESSSPGGATLPYFIACEELDESLRLEALASGMTAGEVESFFAKYAWVPRVLAEACVTGSPVCLYRIEGEDYNALFPLKADPEPADLCRVLWVYSILPENAGSNQAVHPRAVTREATPAERRVGMLHEYGFFRETYGGNALDEMDAWGWHFYDLELRDSTDFVDWPDYIIFHTWGASPLVGRFSEGVDQVGGAYTCGILPEAGEVEVVLSGDDDTACESPGSPFPPGSYPPVVVARQEATGGRLVGLGDLHFLTDDRDNLQLMNNIFDWLDESATGEGPDIDLPVAIAETTLIEGFSGETHFRVCNLGDEPLALHTTLPSLDWITATGPAEVVLASDEAVVYTLAWNSEELSPGYHTTQWQFTSNDPNESVVTWPVRLRVVSAGGIETDGSNAVPTNFKLFAPYPNPFNAQVNISFILPQNGVVFFDLYNVLGQHVERLPVRAWSAGTHQIQLDFTERSAGLYFLRAEYRETVHIQKLMLLK